MRFTVNNNNRKSTRRGREQSVSQRSRINSRNSHSSSQGKSSGVDLRDPLIRPLNVFSSTGQEASHEANSCPIIDDRSNSASPVRKQPHPAGMNTFRGFGQTQGNGERILEWPPPEPRPIFTRFVAPQFGVMLNDTLRPTQNRNVRFLGPTANVQHLIFETGPDVIELDNDDDLDEEAFLHLSQGEEYELQGAVSDLSMDTDIRTQTIDEGVGGVATPRMDNIRRFAHLLVASTNDPWTSEGQMSTEFDQSLEAVPAELAPGVSIIPSNDDEHNEIRVQQTHPQPPPQPIFYVIVDTNEGGHADDEQQAAQFHFALTQLLAQLESTSDEGPRTLPSPPRSRS